jgi:hypothetical protein
MHEILSADVTVDTLRQMRVPHALVGALQVSGGDVWMEQRVCGPPGHNATMQDQQEVRLLCEPYRPRTPAVEYAPRASVRWGSLRAPCVQGCERLQV